MDTSSVAVAIRLDGVEHELPAYSVTRSARALIKHTIMVRAAINPAQWPTTTPTVSVTSSPKV